MTIFIDRDRDENINHYKEIFSKAGNPNFVSVMKPTDLKHHAEVLAKSLKASKDIKIQQEIIKNYISKLYSIEETDNFVFNIMHMFSSFSLAFVFAETEEEAMLLKLRTGLNFEKCEDFLSKLKKATPEQLNKGF